MAETIFQLDLGDEEFIGFGSIEEVIGWVDNERAVWGSITSIRPYANQLKQKFDNLLAQIRNTGNHLSSSPSDTSLERDFTNALRNLSNAVRRNEYILSESPIGKFIHKLGVSDPNLAAATLIAATANENQSLQTDVTSIAGVVALKVFDLGISKQGATTSKRLLTNLTTSFQSRLDDFERVSKEQLAEVDDLVAQREAKVTNSTKALAKLLATKKKNLQEEQFDLRTKTRDELDKLIAESKKKISDFEDFYETKVALLTPVSYWKKKRNGHCLATWAFAIVFLGYSGSLIWLVRRNAGMFGDDLSSFVGFWQDAGIAALGIVALSVGIALIFSRIIYRLFASQLHLWNDAAERVTMTETYLALAEKGHNKDEFMGALINRLFAPASDGVVKDDFGSLGPWDAIAKRLNN